MATITLWHRYGRRCVLIVADNPPSRVLRIVHGDTVLREEHPVSTDQAVLMAHMWEDQEDRSLYGAVPPDRRRD